MFRIGNVEIKNQLVLAPMAGFTDSAFRRLSLENDCGLVYSEMLSVEALVRENKKTLDMLYKTDIEKPLAIQLFGSDPEKFSKAAKIVAEKNSPDIIDINFGCPVPKIAVRSKAGSYLLKDLDKIEKIVKSVVESVDVPVTVKIRTGWDKKNINALEVAKICEGAGASAIAIHGRTRSDGYKGDVDLDIIKKVKQSVNIPVIGNGNIKTEEDAKSFLEYTNCDAIMVGRASIGNPYIFEKINYYLNNGEKITDISSKEKINLCLKHFNYLLEFESETVALLKMRTLVSKYLKGIEDSSTIREKTMKVTSKEELILLLKEFKN